MHKVEVMLLLQLLELRLVLLVLLLLLLVVQYRLVTPLASGCLLQE
jgi:hypothetical protein